MLWKTGMNLFFTLKAYSLILNTFRSKIFKFEFFASFHSSPRQMQMSYWHEINGIGKNFISFYYTPNISEIMYLTFFPLFYLDQMLSSVLPWSPGLECTKQFDCRDGFSLLILSRASHKQWGVAILILINTSASFKFRIVKMDHWLNLNKCPCWDSIRDPFVSEANP